MPLAAGFQAQLVRFYGLRLRLAGALAPMLAFLQLERVQKPFFEKGFFTAACFCLGIRKLFTFLFRYLYKRMYECCASCSEPK